MKKTLCIVMVSLVVLSAISVLAQSQTKSKLTETPLEVAKKAAAYVISQAIPESGGYKWEYYHEHRPGEIYVYFQPVQMAHIGTFLVSLHEKTANSNCLDYAKGAAQWIIYNAVPDSGGYKWKCPDPNQPPPGGWYVTPDTHDIGEFLLKMYQATGNSTYLDYAKGAAQWMAAMAEYEAGGSFIPYNPPGKYGSQAGHGIAPGREAHTATFLLQMYKETGNTTYLTYVKGTAEWLISGPDIRAESGGYKWIHNRPYDTMYSIAGNALVALFFLELYQELGNETYLKYAEGSLQWILGQAVPDGDGCKWPSLDPARGIDRCYLLPMSGIGQGVGVRYVYPPYNLEELLLLAYSITSNSTYLEYAKKHANWVLSQAVTDGDGYRFPEYEEASSYYYNAYINALIYRYLSNMYNAVGNTSYFEYGNGALAWIINNATSTVEDYKWKTISCDPYYPWWFENGASGIGYYLIPALTYLPVYVDIKPGSWPNPINIASEGVIAVAICGTEDFDIMTIDPASIRLQSEDVQEGVPPLRWSYEDVATPYMGEPGGGHALGSDSYLDLVFHFNTQQVVNILTLTEHVGETMVLIVRGNLFKEFDGTTIIGQDYVRILG